MPANTMSRGTAAFLLCIVIGAWGGNWSVGKALLNYLPPLWITAFRAVPACIVLFVICIASRRLTVPAQGDLPVIFSIGLLHMVAFSVLASVGLQYLPAGRSVVLAYTTPLWVLPAARIFLGERLSSWRITGFVMGICGLMVLLQPSAIDWTNREIQLGHGLIMLAALCWAASIVYVRVHRWITPPFELLPWQTLLAGSTLLILAMSFEGVPRIQWSLELVALLSYGSLVGTVVAYWAMNTVSPHLPASVTSMALLGVPIVGLMVSNQVLGEPFEWSVTLAAVLIVGGIALSTQSGRGDKSVA